MDVKRVVHVFGIMNRGGAETFIMNVYRNIDRSKLQFDFIVHSNQKGDYDEEIIKLGGRIFYIDTNKGINHYKNNFNEVIDKYGDFIGVHSHVHQFSGIIVYLAYKKGIKIRISHSHTAKKDLNNSILRNVYSKTTGFLIKKYSTNMLACSQNASYALFHNDSNDDDRIQIIKNGIDIGAYLTYRKDKLYIRNELKIDENSLVIGHVGSFLDVKNHEFIMKIFYSVLKQNLNTHLILVGDGPNRIKIEELAKELNVSDKVSFLGKRSDVNRILPGIDIFILPSIYEGLPVSLIEAQASGKKCIISKNITKEVDMGLSLISFLDISDVSLWSYNIIRYNEEQRGNNNKITSEMIEYNLKDKGYDIKNTVNKLMDIYSIC